MLIWIIPVVACLALIALMLGYPRVTSSRQAGIEGLESPAAAQAYDRLSRSPQFKLLRRMIAGELKNHHPQETIVDAGCGPARRWRTYRLSLFKLHT